MTYNEAKNGVSVAMVNIGIPKSDLASNACVTTPSAAWTICRRATVAMETQIKIRRMG